MKINLPITGKERMFPDGFSLVSKTDTKGLITYANDMFIEVSGYSSEELIGKNHNLVRHPDMPAAAFEDMWTSLKQDLPWHGIVKNRCKNGDYYWVDARVVPIRKNGETIGYMSVRGVPTQQAIAAAELAYKKVVQPGRMSKFISNGLKKYVSIKNCVAFGIVFIALSMVAGGVLGISGLRHSSDSIRSLYYEEMEPARAIGRISLLMADNRAQVALALNHNPGAPESADFDALPVSEHTVMIEKNIREIDGLLKEYGKLPRDEAGRELFDTYEQARSRYKAEGLLPALQALQRSDYAAAENLQLKNVNPLYLDANFRAEKLINFYFSVAANKAISVADQNDKITAIAVGGVSFSIIVVVFAGLLFFRGTVVPLEVAVNALERIAEGDLSGNTDSRGYGEPGRVMAAVMVTQLHLKVMIDEICHSSVAIHQQCRNLNNTAMNISQNSEEQHDRVNNALDSITHLSEKFVTLAQNAVKAFSAAENMEKLHGLTLSEDTRGVGAQEMQQGGDGTADAQNADNNVHNLALTSVAKDEVLMNSSELTKLSRALAGEINIEAIYLEDAVSKMKLAALLNAENVQETQSAWASSQQLEHAARELDGLVKYFE
ncbi:MAG: Tar ligand binding domain-containing protein [Gallionellaceae bacterium]